MSLPFNRESIFEALLTLLKGLTWTDALTNTAGATWLKASRRIIPSAQVDLSMMPALFLCQTKERHTATKGMGSTILLMGDIHVYVNAPEPVGTEDAIAPTTILNPILDAINAVIPTTGTTDPMTGKQTLGGLVEHCVINGEIQTWEGTLGTVELALIPFELLVVS